MQVDDGFLVKIGKSPKRIFFERTPTRKITKSPEPTVPNNKRNPPAIFSNVLVRLRCKY